MTSIAELNFILDHQLVRGYILDPMMEVLFFFLKSLVVVLTIVLCVGGIAFVIALAAQKAGHKSELEIEPLHEKHEHLGHFLKSFLLEKDDLKKELKALKKQEKEDLENHVPGSPIFKKNIFVLNFDGDVHASAVEQLREEITAVLQVARPEDEVVAKIESPGGVVHGYGLAASQLLRLRERNIPLTVCVDQVAASGGYMMACVANKVIAAPFAIVGSIGVVAQVPNFHRVLKKHDVDYKEYTAGEYKRTVSLFGEITPQGEEKFQERLGDTHLLFKKFVQRFRPQVNLSQVATGEYWFGEEALQMGLVDHLQTSDDYLLSFGPKVGIFEVTYKIKKTLADKISDITGQAFSRVLLKIWSRLESSQFL